MWLDFVERLIIKGYSNQRILAAIEDKKRESTQSPKPNETYMDRLIRERLGENVIKSIEERIEKEEASKRLERLARSSEAKTETTPREENNNETYMQRLIRERLGDYKPDNED